MKIVSYIRVSTEKQGRSGLGLDAQKAAIAAYAAKHEATTLGNYIEVESGKNNARPELAKALRQARVTGSRLVIAKLDRLGRNAAFLMNLSDSKLDFVCCDDQHTTPFNIGIKAVIAQHEADMISERTKAALAAAKARGQRLGNPNGADALRRADRGNTASRLAAKAKADAFATDLAETLADVRAAGHQTLHQIAAELNRRTIQTARGGVWHPATVANVIARLPAS